MIIPTNGLTNNTDKTASDLYRLMSWLSPSYPVGAFSYSHGLEWAVETGDIHDVDSLVIWLEDVLRLGSGRNDAILFHGAYDAAQHQDVEKLWEVAALAAALVPSSERRLETLAQGDAFCRITSTAWPGPMIWELARRDGVSVAYPVAVAATVADHDIDIKLGLHAYMHGFTANLVSAAVRLIPLGHTAGQEAMVTLAPAVEACVKEGLEADLEELGGGAFLSDMGSMLHETQYTRLFRS